jgi:hypothetical protein
VFITRNTEYHVRAGRVVAVRALRSGEWIHDHDALDMEVRGHIEPEASVPLPGPPSPGDRLYLARGDRDVVTSTVSAIERPEKALVATYPPEAA